MVSLRQRRHDHNAKQKTKQKTTHHKGEKYKKVNHEITEKVSRVRSDLPYTASS